MKFWKLSVAVLLTVWVTGCGGNSTPVGVVINPVTATVVVRGSQLFSAVGTGSTTTTVNWQICLPPTTSGNQPTNCTPIPGGTASGPTGVGTITQAGQYTAPATVPTTNPILVVATSRVDAKAFATATVTIDSGVRVQIDPLTASISPQERFTFTATVTGAQDQGVTWSVNGIAGGNAQVGFVCPNTAVPTPPACPPGTYVAPANLPGAC